MPRTPSRPTLHEPAPYAIRVQGALDPNWSERLGGLRIQVYKAGGQAVTELSGEVRDQAELVSLLTRLYDLGMTILTVERVNTS